MMGNSPAFQQAVRLINRLARYDVPVLICGETGTGKELAARAIHYQGRRCDHPFVPVNCGAIPDTLVENELFGHDRGAFTDARGSREGLIGYAQGGTLFLDEVDALSPKAQVTMLRFLQDQQYRPLGGERNRQANVRIITATNADLRQLCAQGRFRLDLHYRLCILELAMPPLRDRDGDALLLASHFAAKLAEQHGEPQRRIGEETLGWFERYSWPGNVRELENLMLRAVLLCEGDVIRVEFPDKAPGEGHDKRDPFELHFSRAKAMTLEDFEKRYLASVLARAKGNVTLAAQLAGKERRAFGKLIKKHAIDRVGFRPSL
jgi:DNA-binding NtrC family response regulator